MLAAQNLVNNSPGTITSTVSGTTSTTRSATMSFSEKVTNSFTISEKISIKAGIPGVADFTEETTVRVVCPCINLPHTNNR